MEGVPFPRRNLEAFSLHFWCDENGMEGEHHLIRHEEATRHCSNVRRRDVTTMRWRCVRAHWWRMCLHLTLAIFLMSFMGIAIFFPIDPRKHKWRVVTCNCPGLFTNAHLLHCACANVATSKALHIETQAYACSAPTHEHSNEKGQSAIGCKGNEERGNATGWGDNQRHKRAAHPNLLIFISSAGKFNFFINSSAFL